MQLVEGYTRVRIADTGRRAEGAVPKRKPRVSGAKSREELSPEGR
jgi:hypothetical protein